MIKRIPLVNDDTGRQIATQKGAPLPSLLVPVWAKDMVVSLEASQVLIDALKACGGNVKFTVYPDAGHDIWTETMPIQKYTPGCFNIAKLLNSMEEAPPHAPCSDNPLWPIPA